VHLEQTLEVVVMCTKVCIHHTATELELELELRDNNVKADKTIDLAGEDQEAAQN